MATLLLIDDEREFSEELQNRLQQLGYGVHCLEGAEAGLRHLLEHGADLVLLDNLMPRMTGLEFLDDLSRRAIRIPVILMTGAYDYKTGIEASKRGAFKCVLKSLDYDEVLRELEPILRQALEIYHPLRALTQPGSPAGLTPPRSPARDEDDSPIIGSSEPMRDLHMRIGLLARVDESVLIRGETGTGKELVAKALYQFSRRAEAPFLAINCAAIPEQLLESELFGHEKGAFTHADRRRIGKFEHCNGGTLFLDEIGYMTPQSQSKILRVLQDQRFERIGGNETLQTDVRVIAATNVPLEEAVAAGRFRQDLYYRLNVFTITLPPLRNRGDDLPELVRHYLRRYSRHLGREVQDVAPEAMAVLRRYSWPGNIRQLQSVLKQALLQARGSVLLPEFLPPLACLEPNTGAPDTNEALASLRRVIAWAWLVEGDKKPWPHLEALLQRELLQYALGQPHDSEDQLASRIGIVKNTLRKWKELYGLKKQDDATA